MDVSELPLIKFFSTDLLFTAANDLAFMALLLEHQPGKKSTNSASHNQENMKQQLAIPQ